MKKFLALITTLALLCSMAVCVSAAGTPTLSVSSATAKAGETVSVTLDIANNPGITAYNITIDYDPAYLELVSAEAGEIFGKMSFSGSTTTRPYGVNWSDDENDFTDVGTIATYTFKVLETTPAGDYAITVDYDPDNVYNADMDNIDFDKVNGKITVEGEPAPSYTYTATKFNKTADGLALEVAYTEAANVAGKVLVASYANDGKTLVDVVFVDVNAAADTATPIDYSALITTGATSYKAMLWADLTNCMPIIDALAW